MKVVRFKANALSQARLGVLKDDGAIVDVNRVVEADCEDKGYFNSAERAEVKLSSDLSTLLKVEENPIEKLQQALELFKSFNSGGITHTKQCLPLSFKLSDEQTYLTKPLDSIITYRDFYTHLKHVEVGFKKRNEPIPEAWFEMPVYYKGSVSNFIGPEQEITWPSYSDKLDYELELALVMAKDGKNIKAEHAFCNVFGFTILNDVSARDIQKKEMSVRLGPSKGKDFCSVLGPAIVTADEFNFESPDLKMQAFINGEKWSEGQSGDAHFSWEQMIEFASRDEWLRSTDVLGSGTVGTGCGLEVDKWIQPGDEIEFVVEKIGSLKNKVGQKQGGGK